MPGSGAIRESTKPLRFTTGIGARKYLLDSGACMSCPNMSVATTCWLMVTRTHGLSAAISGKPPRQLLRLVSRRLRMPNLACRCDKDAERLTSYDLVHKSSWAHTALTNISIKSNVLLNRNCKTKSTESTCHLCRPSHGLYRNMAGQASVNFFPISQMRSLRSTSRHIEWLLSVRQDRALQSPPELRASCSKQLA